MDIVGIGRPCMDMISVLEKLPKSNAGARILDFSKQGGGVVPTAMVAGARLGAKVGFIGVSGTCTNGKAIREDFEYNHVDISKSITHEGAYSDFAIILSDLETNGRSILYKRGDVRDLTVGDLDKEYLMKADFLHLDHYEEIDKTAATWMREAGKKVVYDASHYSDEIDAFLPYIDIFIASEFYYEAAFDIQENFEENCRQLTEKGPETVVFTLGEKGCVGFSEIEGFFEAKSYNTTVVDTVGAGDVFHGAFLFGLSKGWRIKDIAQFSNAVSAIKIGAIGGRAGIPSYETTKRFMETGEIDHSEISERIRHYRDKWLYNQ